MLALAIDSVVPLVVMLLLGQICYNLYKFVLSLQVTGKANEWVVVINNGVMKQAGIGLSVMREPNDLVAIFPTKVNKVVLNVEQITDEMQGLKV
jgi:hypothetical protein